jgi:hypothetical protein
MAKLRDPNSPRGLHKITSKKNSEEYENTTRLDGASAPPRATNGQLLPGQSLNWEGRGLGVKNHLSRAFLEDLKAIWETHGKKMLERLVKKDPRSLVQVMASLVPKEMVIDETQRVYVMRDTPLTVEEWEIKHAGGSLPIPDVHH